MESSWLIDSGCSRHMTRDRRWFFSLTPVMNKEYNIFEDNGKGTVLSEGVVQVSDNFGLKFVALIKNLGFNLLSVSQLLTRGLRFGLSVVPPRFLILEVILFV